MGALLPVPLAVALTWRWADRTYATGARVHAYWIGVAGSAIPALVVGSCTLWLWRERLRGQSAASVRWLNPLLVLSLAFLALMLVLPLL